MGRRTRVPIRVVTGRLPEDGPRAASTVPVQDTAPPVVECGEYSQPLAGLDEPLEAVASAGQEESEMWRDRALRLEAEMDNFRKRQRRLAEHSVAADRQRLLLAFLTIADDLSRALSADGADAASLAEGVHITYQSMMNVLDQEGVESIDAEGQTFDPAWHEAVGAVHHRDVGAVPDTVVEVVQPGYRLGKRLLRPARVVVAT